MKILFLIHKSAEEAFKEFSDELNLYRDWLLKHQIPHVFDFESWDEPLEWQKFGQEPNEFYTISENQMKSLGSKAWWEPGEYHLIFYLYAPEKEHSAGVFCTMNWFECNGGVGITVPITKELATLPTQWGWRMLAHESIHAFYAILNLIYHKNIPDVQDQLYQEYRKLHPNPTEDELAVLSEMLFENDIKTNLNLILQDLPAKRTATILMGIIAVLNGIVALLKDKLNQPKEDKKRKVISRLAHIIAIQEGFYKIGTIAQRNNNPGNLVYVGQSKAIGQDKNGFCIFATEQDGWDALYFQLSLILDGKSRYYSPEMTIREFVETWAPTSPKDEKDAYARAIAYEFGCEVETKLNQLT